MKLPHVLVYIICANYCLLHDQRNTFVQSDAWINEIHYDNDGADSGEFVEIAHPGISIDGYQVIHYNGNNGLVVTTKIITNSSATGYTALTYPVNGLENGSPDGIALLHSNGTLIEFLSYEGVFTAAAGPAQGKTSTDILVNETSTTAAGLSLQKCNNSATKWTGPIANTSGAANNACSESPPMNAPASAPVNAPATVPVVLISSIQGSGSPISTPYFVNVTAIITSIFTTNDVKSGFWMQEEDADADSDPQTSEGIYVHCGSTRCPIVFNIGDRVNVAGRAEESFTTTRIDATVISGVVTVLSSNNVLPTPVQITLPAEASTKNFSTYKHLEGMIVKYSGTLFVSEVFELARFGSIDLTESSVPYTFTHNNLPNLNALNTFNAILATRRIVLDDDNDDQNDAITGTLDEAYFYPTGGLSTTNKFRIGDTVFGLTGVLQYSFGEWRLRPTAFNYTFIKSNPEPAFPPVTNGRLRVISYNVLNYFTTLDTSTTGCSPTGTMECRGANTVAELNRQRSKIVATLEKLNPDVAGLVELENSGTDAAKADIVAALNAGQGQGTYAYISTGFIGTDAIQVGIIYKNSTVAPVGAFRILDSSVDPNFLDTKNRPVLVQTFREIATGQRFTVSVCHFKSKGSACTDVSDPDLSDGQGNCAQTRKKAVVALVKFLATDPTGSGDTDHLILGDINAYAREDAVVAFENGGFTNLGKHFGGSSAYSYVFDGLRGNLDYAFASTSLLSQVVNVSEWHTNSDEINIFDYNDAIRDLSETTFERKSDAKTIYASDPFRSSDHDPVLVGLSLTSPPTNQPSKKPSNVPTKKPTNKPSNAPTKKPTNKPSNAPTKKPTNKPTSPPSENPTDVPTPAPCRKLGRLCETNVGCCSNVCYQSRCSSCLLDGKRCSRNRDCCNKRCNLFSRRCR